MKLVLPMLNNWDDLGGINTYTNAFGGSATSFYTDAESQAAYKKYIEFIVNRYKYSSAIFAWELCNEPRCRGCDRSVITNWASTTSAFIKSLDPDHMVALGDEGWFYPPESDGSYAYSGYEGVDFVRNLDIKTLDYGTFHMYPDQCKFVYVRYLDFVVILMACVKGDTTSRGVIPGSNSMIKRVQRPASPSSSRSTARQAHPMLPLRHRGSKPC